MSKPHRPGFKILSPTAILGYGFPDLSLSRGLALRPDAIAVDAGSTDPGPYYLGSGKPFTSRAGVKRDLERLLPAALENGIPLIVGSCGGSGAAPHLEWTVEIVREVVAGLGRPVPLALVPADIPRELVADRLRRGGLQPMAGVPELTEAALAESTYLVAQMGWEPIAAALDQGYGVVLCGRAYDPAVFAAPAIRAGFDPGLALHMGKILECAAIAATPGSGSDCVLGTLHEDHFELQTLSRARAFTASSVAAHALYEKADPYRLDGPGGSIDLRAAEYQDLGGGRVRVRGGRYEPTEDYTVKLEGAKPVGFRTVSIAGVRDPRFIERSDQILGEVSTLVLDGAPASAELRFHVYGKNGVMGSTEPSPGTASHELGIVIEALGENQEAADALCSRARSTLLHHGYPGRISTAGNLALPFSPSDFPGGPVYEFSVYHVMEVADATSLFPVRDQTVAP